MSYSIESLEMRRAFLSILGKKARFDQWKYKLERNVEKS